MEGLEISIGIVGDSVFPASKQDTDPFEGQGAHGDVVIFASGDLGLVVGLSPGAETDRVRSELVKRLPLELWAGPAEMDAGTLAAGDAHGGNAVQGRHVAGDFETVAVGAEGRQQSWS